MERCGGDFKGEPHQDKNNTDDGAVPGAGGEDASDGCKIRGAGKAIDQRNAVDEQAGGERAEYEIFQPRLSRAQGVPRHCGADIERQGLQLEADIEGHQVGSRDHGDHAEHSEDNEDGKLEAGDRFAAVIVH